MTSLTLKYCTLMPSGSTLVITCSRCTLFTYTLTEDLLTFVCKHSTPVQRQRWTWYRYNRWNAFVETR